MHMESNLHIAVGRQLLPVDLIDDRPWTYDLRPRRTALSHLLDTPYINWVDIAAAVPHHCE